MVGQGPIRDYAVGRGRLPLGHRMAVAVHCQGPLGQVVVMGSPVDQPDPGVLVPPAEVFLAVLAGKWPEECPPLIELSFEK